MRYLILKNFVFYQEKGFTLIELIVVLIIVGIGAGLGVASLVGSQRQARANQALNNLRSALQSAQANANRMSTDCNVIIDDSNPDFYQFRSSTTGCLQETVQIDKEVVNISPNTATITFNFNGSIDAGNTSVTLPATFTIARMSGGTPDTTNANCLVVSELLGLIRTGKVEGTDCVNIENLKYDNEN